MKNKFDFSAEMNDHQNIEYRMWYENIVVCLADFPLSFITFDLNLI